MSQRVLGTPCPPCARRPTDLAAAPEGALEASAQADAACSPATDDAPEANASHKFAHLIGRSFSFDADDDDLAGPSCPHPLSTEDDGASCPRSAAEEE